MTSTCDATCATVPCPSGCSPLLPPPWQMMRGCLRRQLWQYRLRPRPPPRRRQQPRLRLLRCRQCRRLRQRRYWWPAVCRPTSRMTLSTGRRAPWSSASRSASPTAASTVQTSGPTPSSAPPMAMRRWRSCDGVCWSRWRRAMTTTTPRTSSNRPLGLRSSMTIATRLRCSTSSAPTPPAVSSPCRTVVTRSALATTVISRRRTCDSKQRHCLCSAWLSSARRSAPLARHSST